MTEKSIQTKRFLPSWRSVGLVICVLLASLLTGCVRYDVGINFDGQHRGAIVQHITLGQQLTSLNQSEAKKWLDSIEARARQLQGRVKYVSPQEALVTIPFGNGQELVSKFNRFFNPTPQERPKVSTKQALDLVQLKSEMSLAQSNFLFVERDRLDLTVDLRALGVLSNQGKIIVSPGSLIDLEFQLQTPWLARSIINQEELGLEIRRNGKQIIWQLQPGQINHIEAVFWLPSTLGIGTAIILLLAIAGFYLKYRRLPGVEPA